MYWQIEQYRLGKSLTVGATDKIDLPKRGKLGSIFLVLHSDAVSGGLDAQYNILPEEFISKIEVYVNGSTKIKSLDMKALQVLNWLDQGIYKPDKNLTYAGATQRSALLINFGRYLYDTECGLNLEDYNIPELWITNIGTSADWSGFSVDVYLVWLRGDDAPDFKGYYQTEEFRAWTPVAGETEYIDLPTNGKLRRFLLRGEAGVVVDSGSYNKFNNIIYEMKYSLRSGALIVYEGRCFDIAWLNLFEAKSKPLTAYQIDQIGSSVYKRTGLGYVFARPFGVKATDTTVPATVPGETGGGDDSAFGMTVSAVDWSAMVAEYGMAPWSHIFWRHDIKGEAGEGLDLDMEKVVQLEVLCRSGTTVTGANSRLILDRYMPR